VGKQKSELPQGTLDLLILKTLNFFDYELTKTPYLDKIEFGTMKAWDDIKTKINRRPG